MVAQRKTAEPAIINGINVDDLFALIDGVRRDAAKGKTNWRVTTTWQGQTRSRALVEGFGIGGERVPRRFSIDIDEPCELGGSNRFANPRRNTCWPRSMLASWLATWRNVPCAESPSKDWRLKPMVRLISAASSESIPQCRRATRS